MAGGHGNMYGDPLNFLLFNYGVAGPVPEEPDKDTYYVPLSVKDRYESSRERRRDRTERSRRRSRSRSSSRDNTYMIDVTKVKIKPSLTTGQGQSQQGTATTQQGTATTQPEQSGPAKKQTPPPPPPDKKSALGTADTKGQGDTTALPATGSHEIVLRVPIDTREDQPSVPENRDLSQKSTTQPTCDELDSQTEAGTSCIKCVKGVEKHTFEKFLETVSAKVKSYEATDNRNMFQDVVNQFCKECKGVDVADFVSYMEKRAKEASVPKEILFAILMRESTGTCGATGDEGGKSRGLFQLNTENSTKLRSCKENELKGQSTGDQKKACEGGGYRKSSEYGSTQYTTKPEKRAELGDLVCLENPYCNFEEALHLLMEDKWKMVNGKKEPPGGSWADLSPEQRNQWRNAVIAYNSNHYHQKAKKAMKQELGLNANLDDWELKRMFFIKNYLRSDTKKEWLIGNLAYVERMTGREIKGGLAKSSICQWARYRKDNPYPSCR